MIELDEFYMSFGKEVIEEVKKHLELNGNLAPVLYRLNASALPGLTSQHMALRDFLYKYGTVIFLKAMRTNISTEEIERLKIQKLMSFSNATTASVKSDNRAQFPAAKITYYKPGGSKPGTAKPGAGKPQPANPEPPKEQALPAEPEGPKWIESPTYVGPDRRTGKDRRKAQYGRRMRTEGVRLERRKGGRRDRRQTPRREDDRVKAAQNRPGLPPGFGKKS